MSSPVFWGGRRWRRNWWREMLPSRSQLRRRLQQGVLALFALSMLGSVSLVGAAAINDHHIESQPGRALATVTGTSFLRAAVDFQDVHGVYQSPPTGVLYPTGLTEGQHVWVTYALDDPTLVKVQGRRWTLAIIPAVSLAVVAGALCGLLWYAAAWVTRSREVTEVPVSKIQPAETQE